MYKYKQQWLTRQQSLPGFVRGFEELRSAMLDIIHGLLQSSCIRILEKQQQTKEENHERISSTTCILLRHRRTCKNDVHLYFGSYMSYRGIVGHFPDPVVQLMIQADLDTIDYYDPLTRSANRKSEKRSYNHTIQTHAS